jgi:hypothetical protein
MNKDNKYIIPKISSFKYNSFNNAKSFVVHPQYKKYLNSNKELNKKYSKLNTNLKKTPILDTDIKIIKETTYTNSFKMGSDIVFYSDINEEKHKDFLNNLFKNKKEEHEKQRLLELERLKKEEHEKQRLLELERLKKEEHEKQRYLN